MCSLNSVQNLSLNVWFKINKQKTHFHFFLLEIELLKNSPGIITKLQSPNSHLHHLELDQHAFDKLKAGERAESNLAAAFAQAKLILPDQKDKSANLNRHLSSSMNELCTATAKEDEEACKKQAAQTEKGKPRRNSIRQWVAGATHKKVFSAVSKQLKESLSRESSLERTDQTTGAQTIKQLAKIPASSSLLPQQFSLKDDAVQSSLSNDKSQPKIEKKRRMSTLSDWKPIFHSGSSASPFSARQPQQIPETDDLNKAKKSTQIVDKNQEESNDQFGSLERPSQLKKLDEEAEEDEDLTALSSPQLSKRSSAVAIHEMKPLSPGTSLSGVFYCSSSVQSISNRKSSLSIQTQTSSRTSINSSTGDASTNSGQNNSRVAGKLQRRSTLNVGHYRRATRLTNKEDLSDKDKDMQINIDLEAKSKRRSVSSDLSIDNAFPHSTLLTHHHQRTIHQQQQQHQQQQRQSNDYMIVGQQQSTEPTTSNYAITQPSSIVRETIVEEIGQGTITNVPQHTAIDFNQPDIFVTTTTNQVTDTVDTLTTANIICKKANSTGSRHSSYTSSSSKHRSPKSGRGSARHSSVGGGDQQTAKASKVKTGSLDTTATVQPRKFCVYFRWYSWMTRRDAYSLFIFPPDNKLRLKFIKITDHKCFDYVVLIFISLNCITLAMERPRIPPWSAEREILNAANYIFTFIFTLEMALKVIAKGFYYSPDAYLKSMWNKLDAFLVGISLFDLFLTLVSQRSPRILGILRVFRLLRSLRPLR